MRKARTISRMLSLAFMAGIIAWPGCKKNDSGTGPGEGAGGVVTVTGRAVGLNLQPLQHFPVVIAGHAATVSDDSGSFTITGVQTPYDIIVIDPSAGTPGALVYLGLKRPDPTLVWLQRAPGNVRAGSMTGTVSGGNFAPSQGANDQTEILFLTAGTSSTASIDGATTGDFGMGASWYGAPTTVGSLFALQFTADAVTGLPVSGGFKAFGSATNVGMTDGQTRNGQPLALQALAPSQTGQFTATIAPPAGFRVTEKRLFIRPGVNGLIQILADTTETTSVSYFAPAGNVGTLTMHVRTSNGQGASADVIQGGLGVGGTPQQFTPPSPPELSLPVSGATAVDTTTQFSWKPLAGGVHHVLFSPVVSAAGSFEIVTAGSICRIPNLRPYGMTLPHNSDYSWNILAVGPAPSVDDAADRSFVRLIQRSGEIATTLFLAETGARDFRTAP